MESDEAIPTARATAAPTFDSSSIRSALGWSRFTRSPVRSGHASSMTISRQSLNVCSRRLWSVAPTHSRPRHTGQITSTSDTLMILPLTKPAAGETHVQRRTSPQAVSRRAVPAPSKYNPVTPHGPPTRDRRHGEFEGWISC